MRHVTRIFLTIVGIFSVLTTARAESVDATLKERLELSTNAFQALMQSADSKIPTSLLMKAEAVVIFPRTINVAWGLGGEYGQGVAFKHHKRSLSWSGPAFYSLGGLTLGPQIGGQAIDIVLVVVNEKGFESLLKSKCTLGGDAGIAVGPAGRNATVSTDLALKSEIYSYSRAKGLYIGLSLKGAVVAPDNNANEKYYGRPITAKAIFETVLGPAKGADGKLVGLLGRYSLDWLKLLPWIAGMVLVIFLAALFFSLKKTIFFKGK